MLEAHTPAESIDVACGRELGTGTSGTEGARSEGSASKAEPLQQPVPPVVEGARRQAEELLIGS